MCAIAQISVVRWSETQRSIFTSGQIRSDDSSVLGDKQSYRYAQSVLLTYYQIARISIEINVIGGN